MPTDHRSYGVRSVIDVRAWNQAKWKGTAYAQMTPDHPPYLAFIFENEDGARRIFSRWRERFGPNDEQDEIYIGIARHISSKNPHHYGVVVTSEWPHDQKNDQRQLLTISTRSLTMQPQSDVNLNNFLGSYAKFGIYYLMPAIVDENGSAKFLSELAIVKRKLTVKEASSVSDNDVESILLSKNRPRFEDEDG